MGSSTTSSLTLDHILSAIEKIKRLSPAISIQPSRIFESFLMVKRIQVKFPRCKSKRIHKKWKIRDKNWISIPSDEIFVTPNGLFCHPTTAKILKRSVDVVTLQNIS